MISARLKFAAALVIAVVITCAPLSLQGAEQPRYMGLTILHTNDRHGHLFPFDYNGLGKPEADVGGTARGAALIRQIKGASERPVLVMDAGDVFTRGPLADMKGVPDFAAMNAVPYDIMVLGNNEFSGAPGLEGQRIMLDRVKQAKFPVISANVVDQTSGKTIVPAYEVFDLNGLKVGVFGLTAPRVANYSQARGLGIRDPISTAKKTVPELREKADFIIALTHIGYQLDMELATSVPGIDVIIGGDSHTWLFEPTLVKREEQGAESWWVGGTIICQAGEWGKAIGKLDLSLRLTEDGEYKVMGYTGTLENVDSSIEPAKDIENIVYSYAKPYLREVGKLDKDVPLADASAWIAERIRMAAGTQVGVMPRGGVENGLKAGMVSYLDIRRMFPFVNPVFKLTVTGKQLLDFVSQTDSGLAGAAFREDGMYVGGAKLDESAKYTLAIESFYAQTSPALAGSETTELGKTTRDVITEYVAGK